MLDEAHLLLSDEGYRRAILRRHNTVKLPSASVVFTQAVMRFNSGKRVRFLVSAGWADTGKRIAPGPRKFVPAQVLRRDEMSI